MNLEKVSSPQVVELHEPVIHSSRTRTSQKQVFGLVAEWS